MTLSVLALFKALKFHELPGENHFVDIILEAEDHSHIVLNTEQAFLWKKFHDLERISENHKNKVLENQGLYSSILHSLNGIRQ